MLDAVRELTSLYLAADQLRYSDGQAGSELKNADFVRVSLLAHSLQTAALAQEHFPEDDELIVSALLHDVGWALPKPSDLSLLVRLPPSAQCIFLRKSLFAERACEAG
jgi:predicted HD phosphohydrolase